MKGIIKFYKQQGYGFISAEDNKDYFFHISDVEQIYKQNIKNGQAVTFVPFETRRGSTAKSITILQQNKPKSTDDYLSEIEEKNNIVSSKNIENVCIYFCLTINILLFTSIHVPKMVFLLSVLSLISLFLLIYLKQKK